MPNTTRGCSELEMQEKVAEYFSKRSYVFNNEWSNRITPKVYREVRISKIGRISDIIIYLTDRRIINIECKLFDYGVVLQQAIDHLRWADYSYICLYADVYLPAYVIDKMITNGIGLLFWTPNLFVEVIQSGYNKRKDKSVHDSVLAQLKKRNHIITAESESNNQLSNGVLKKPFHNKGKDHKDNYTDPCPESHPVNEWLFYFYLRDNDLFIF